MPTNLTAEDHKAIVENLDKDYFLIRKQTALVAAALLGIGTITAAWTSAKVAISTGAAAVATKDIEEYKKNAESELGIIHNKQMEATKIANNFAPYSVVFDSPEQGNDGLQARIPIPSDSKACTLFLICKSEKKQYPPSFHVFNWSAGGPIKATQITGSSPSNNYPVVTYEESTKSIIVKNQPTGGDGNVSLSGTCIFVNK